VVFVVFVGLGVWWGWCDPQSVILCNEYTIENQFILNRAGEPAHSRAVTTNYQHAYDGQLITHTPLPCDTAAERPLDSAVLQRS